MGNVVRGLAAALVAAAAIVSGHALVYELTPPGHRHTDALGAAGHLSWPAPWLAAVLLAILGAAVYGVARDRRRGGPSWGALVPVLAAAQVAGFLVLETGERVAAGLGVAHLLTEPVVTAGVLVQVLAAAVSAALLHAGARLVVRFARSRRSTSWSAKPRPSLGATTVARPISRPDRLRVTRRGPPVRC